MNQDFLIITSFLAVTICVPSFIAFYVFNFEPSLPVISLLILSSFLAIHPAFGFSIPSYLKLSTAKKPQMEVKAVEAPKSEPMQQTFNEPDRLICYYEELKNEFLDLVDLEKQPADGENWKVILTQQRNQYQCSVQKKPNTDFFFRIVVDFEATMEEAFDLLADIEKRKEWDELTQSAGLVERTSFVSTIQFMKTKEIWPTAARDALVMAFTKKLEDGRYINITKSIDSHPNYASKTGHVRMLASIAGLVVGPHPSGNPKLCRCIQVVNGDLGGWLPASVVSVVTTQAFPISMRRANTKLKKIENHKTVSDLILFSEGKVSLAGHEGTSTAPEVPPEIAQPGRSKNNDQVIKQRNFLSTIFKNLKTLQPWMVLAILIIVALKRR